MSDKQEWNVIVQNQDLSETHESTCPDQDRSIHLGMPRLKILRFTLRLDRPVMTGACMPVSLACW